MKLFRFLLWQWERFDGFDRAILGSLGASVLFFISMLSFTDAIFIAALASSLLLFVVYLVVAGVVYVVRSQWKQYQQEADKIIDKLSGKQ